MATYAELQILYDANTHIDKIRIALGIAADTIRTEDPGTVNHANRLILAKNIFNNPDQYIKPFWLAMLAAYNSSTVATIEALTDANIQTGVNNVLDIFAGV